MEKRPTPGLVLRKFKMSLEPLMPKSKEVLKDDRDLSVGDRNQLEGASACQIWDNLCIKINNDKKMNTLLNK